MTAVLMIFLETIALTLLSNANKLMNKMDELKARIHTTSPAILVLIEVNPKTGSSMIITAVR